MHERIRLTLLFNCEMEKGARGWISIKSVNSRKVANSEYTAQRTSRKQSNQIEVGPKKLKLSAILLIL